MVLEGEVCERDSRWSLARLAFAGGSLWARDLGLCRRPCSRYSWGVWPAMWAWPPAADRRRRKQNHLPGVVDASPSDEHPGLTLVRVRVGASALLARLTSRAAHELGVHPGQPIWLQVKSVALMRQPAAQVRLIHHQHSVNWAIYRSVLRRRKGKGSCLPGQKVNTGSSPEPDPMSPASRTAYSA